MKKKKPSQNERILLHLQRRAITPIDALRLYGCFRLASRINNLREQGHKIETVMIEKNGKRFASYRLKS